MANCLWVLDDILMGIRFAEKSRESERAIERNGRVVALETFPAWDQTVEEERMSYTVMRMIQVCVRMSI